MDSPWKSSGLHWTRRMPTTPASPRSPQSVRWIRGLLVLLVLVSALLVAMWVQRDVLYDSAMAVEADKADWRHAVETVGSIEWTLYESRDTPSTDAGWLVMIHGFSGSKENWLRLGQALRGDYRMLVPDLPGHGETRLHSPFVFTVPNQVEALHDLFAARGIDRVHLVGNSMGGAIAALYAARYPQQVQSLTLLNPAGVHDRRSPMQDLLDEGVNPLVMQTPDDFDRVLDFVMEQRPFIPWPISTAAAERSAARLEINNQIFRDLRETLSLDFKQEVTGIRAPTLIVWGAHDRVIDAGNADILKGLIAGSEVVILPQVGHLPMIEDPATSADLVRRVAVTRSGPE